MPAASVRAAAAAVSFLTRVPLGRAAALGGADVARGAVVFPVVGAAIGAATGAVASRLIDVGIDDDFIKEVRGQVTPGTSALFLLSSDAEVEKVRVAFRATGLRMPQLIRSNLSEEQEATLREYFG